MYNVGDYVTRKSYNNDIIFKIIRIDEGNYILKGINVRLIADSPASDLVIKKEIEKDDNFRPKIPYQDGLNRNEYFYLPGKILHLDGDKKYLSRCLSFYKNNQVNAIGKFVSENNMSSVLSEYLEAYNPDILVLTGHDSYSKKRNNDYKNSSYFCRAVREARKYEKSHDKLLIVAGACQSNYEDLIKAGSNFASSPKRINIHALDPAIIATCLSYSKKNEDIDLIDIISRTKYGEDGIGGIITKGTMYVGYPR